MGGMFPGAPTAGVGFTAEHGWGATVNKPDLVDIYVLEINPKTKTNIASMVSGATSKFDRSKLRSKFSVLFLGR